VCKDNLDCYERLTVHLQQSWYKLLQKSPEILHIKKNRRLTCTNIINIQLHSYCDSSEGLIERVHTFAEETNNQSTCEWLFCIVGCAFEAVTNTKTSSVQLYADQTLQKGHTGLQHCHCMDRFLHSACVDPRTIQQVRYIFGEHGCQDPRRHIICNLEACVITV